MTFDFLVHVVLYTGLWFSDIRLSLRPRPLISHLYDSRLLIGYHCPRYFFFIPLLFQHQTYCSETSIFRMSTVHTINNKTLWKNHRAWTTCGHHKSTSVKVNLYKIYYLITLIDVLSVIQIKTIEHNTILREKSNVGKKCTSKFILFLYCNYCQPH